MPRRAGCAAFSATCLMRRARRLCMVGEFKRLLDTAWAAFDAATVPWLGTGTRGLAKRPRQSSGAGGGGVAIDIGYRLHRDRDRVKSESRLGKPARCWCIGTPSAPALQ